MRNKIGEYQQLVNQLAQEQRKLGQTLLTKDLTDLQIPPISTNSAISESITKSEYLEVVFLVVPK